MTSSKGMGGRLRDDEGGVGSCGNQARQQFHSVLLITLYKRPAVQSSNGTLHGDTRFHSGKIFISSSFFPWLFLSIKYLACLGKRV